MAGPSWGQGDMSGIRDQRLWSIKECLDVFKHSVQLLRTKLSQVEEENSEAHYLVWDKVGWLFLKLVYLVYVGYLTFMRLSFW